MKQYASRHKRSDSVVNCSMLDKASELTGVRVGMQIELYDPRHLDAVIRLSHGEENLWIWKNYFKPEI